MRLECKNSAAGICLALASLCYAQEAPSTPDQAGPPVSGPLPTPSITGPLTGLPPAIFEAGPFGKIAVNGVLTGMGIWQGNHVPGDDSTQAALSNGQVFLQKTDGWLQFYLQAGAYNIPSLGTPFLSTDKTLSNLWGPVPVGFLKFQAGKNTSIEVGSFPTLIGAEYTFSFENMNVERGLLWNQEPAVSKGIQVNQTLGKFTASLSWNDGYYSNRYSWLSGSLAYSHGPHSVAFIAGGNLGLRNPRSGLCWNLRCVFWCRLVVDQGPQPALRGGMEYADRPDLCCGLARVAGRLKAGCSQDCLPHVLLSPQEFDGV